MTYIHKQAKFYDSYPPLIPWPDLLEKYGLSRLYKPREVFWKKSIDSLGLKRTDVVLDFGCGQGLTLARLAKAFGCKGIGIDISGNEIFYAQQNYSTERIKYTVFDGMKLPIKDKYFDAVITFDTLEHIENQELAVSEMLRVLKPGGKLLIYTLNSNDKWTFDWWREKFGMDIYSRAAHKRDLFVDPYYLKSLLGKSGMSDIQIHLFDAFFTLFLDEIIMLYIVFCMRTKIMKYKFFGELTLLIMHFISFVFYYPLVLLDWIWFVNRKSLSFTITGNKS